MSSAKSPIFSHMSHTLDGHISIKAFGIVEEFNKTFQRHQDVHTSAYNLFICSYRWMGLSIAFVSTGYLLVVIVATFAISSTGRQN